MKLLTTGIVFIIAQICNTSADYFWRDYDNAKIPDDAFIAGQNKAGKNIYVGQAIRFFNKENATGLVPVQINTGEVEVFTYSGNGVAGFKVNLKILCGTSGSFKWITTNSISYDKDVAGKHLIKGGRIFADNYIGKTTDGVVGDKIGSVEPENSQNFNPKNLKVMYVINERANSYSATNYFQILTHEGDAKSCGPQGPFNVNVKVSKEGTVTCEKLN